MERLPVKNMDVWDRLEVGASGRPQLLPTEVTFLMEPKITVEPVGKPFFDTTSAAPKSMISGTFEVTSHGIVFCGSSVSVAFRLPYERVVRVSTEAKGFFSKTYEALITVSPRPWACAACTFLNDPCEKSCNVCTTPQLATMYIDATELVLRVCGQDGRKLVAAIQEALEKKLWESSAPGTEPGKLKDTATSSAASEREYGAGIAGLLQRQNMKLGREKKLAEGAFMDLDSLMSMAQDIVRLTERYSEDRHQRMYKRDGEGQSVGEGADTEQFVSILNRMGISNPVTKEVAGSMFTEQLARQLCDFLEEQLRGVEGSMLQLTDVYCMYNRARGTTLVSPEEFMGACQMFETLQLPMRLRTLEGSGVLVIQPATHDDRHAAENAAALIAANGKRFITTSEFAFHQNIPLVLANGQLEASERLRKICRDVTMEGTRWYSTEPFDTGTWML